MFDPDTTMFDPDAKMPRINRAMVYLCACLLAGLKVAGQKQVNIRLMPTKVAIADSLDLAHDIYDYIFRKMPERMARK